MQRQHVRSLENVPNEATRAPAFLISAVATIGSKTRMVHLNGTSRCTTSRPMRPKPITPTVRSRMAFMSAKEVVIPHLPTRRGLCGAQSGVLKRE